MNKFLVSKYILFLLVVNSLNMQIFCIIDQKKQTDSWESVFNQEKNKIVQIFSYSVQYDWTMPFRRGEMEIGLGTGFIVSADGEIYTNFHVVNNAEVIFVQIPSLGKERFEVSFLGGCPDYDCARLKIKPNEFERLQKLLNYKNLDYVTFGTSDNLSQNKKVMLIGYPLGQENVKSALGCISGREDGLASYGEWITTTLPANPGHSGSPCFDKQGNVLGILVAGEKNAQGLTYLIPIDSVKTIMPELVEGKVVRSPYWGLTVCGMTLTTLRYFNIPIDFGVYVKGVGKNSLAEHAGIVLGDVIVAINDYPVDRFGYVDVPWSSSKVECASVLARFAKNEKVTASVYRDGKKIECTINLTFDLPFKIIKKYPTFEEKPKYDVFGGMVIMEMTMNHLQKMFNFLHRSIEEYYYHPLFRYINLDNCLNSRLLITYIFPDTDLAKSGVLKSSDVVLSSVNGYPVYTIEDLHTAILMSSSDYCVFRTESGVKFVLSLAEVIEQDSLFAERYGYVSSPLIKKICQN